MTEVEYNESRIRELRGENEKLRQKEQNDKLASGLRAIFESLVIAGFSEEQAWELFKGMCKRAWYNG